jgi:nucleoside-diphosphate kinase
MRTLCIIKPDCVPTQTGAIQNRLYSNGWRIAGIKAWQLTVWQAGAFYLQHKDKPFYLPLCNFMTSGHCVAMVIHPLAHPHGWDQEHVVRSFLDLVGATNPIYAAVGTLRSEFGDHNNWLRNAVHASSSAEVAEREIAFWFAGLELV